MVTKSCAPSLAVDEQKSLPRPFLSGNNGCDITSACIGLVVLEPDGVQGSGPLFRGTRVAHPRSTLACSLWNRRAVVVTESEPGMPQAHENRGQQCAFKDLMTHLILQFA